MPVTESFPQRLVLLGPVSSPILDGMREIAVLLRIFAQAEDIPPGTLRVVCAWCGKWLGDKPSGNNESGLSHGMCQSCSDEMLRKNGIDPETTRQGEYVASSLREVQELLWLLGP